MIWREVTHPYPAHYEQWVGRLRGYTLRVRGPRGGGGWRWTVADGRLQVLAHGTSVESDLAQHAAEFHAPTGVAA